MRSDESQNTTSDVDLTSHSSSSSRLANGGTVAELHTSWAPAKVNLSLHIKGKRLDGFHELETIMTPVSIYDQIGVRLSNDSKIKFRVISSVDTRSSMHEDHVKKIPFGSDNLVVQVAQAFQQEIQSESGAEILLRKVIPAGGGLGGASTNAATTLQLLNQIWDAGWSLSQLADFAASFGSDIPFFFSQGAAICTGRGEKIASVSCDCSVWLVVVRPNFGLSTPEVFKTLRAAPWNQSDATPKPKLPASDGLSETDAWPSLPSDKLASDNLASDALSLNALPLKAVSSDAPSGNEWSSNSFDSQSASLLSLMTKGRWQRTAACLKNDLTPPAKKVRPELHLLEASLKRTNPIAYQMSGSGSCYFAIYRSRREANRSAKQLRNYNVGRTFVVRPTVRTLNV